MTHIRLDTVDSTNSYLRQHRSSLPDGTLVTARLQTAGRGRRGHDWLADDGMLPLSLLLKNPPHPDSVTLCATIAVCRASEQLFPEESFGIKWPNDIILRGHKLCGILCESVCIGSSIEIICGIGINISQTADFFEKSGIPHGGSLEMLTGKTVPDKEAFAEKISQQLYELSRSGFDKISDAYCSRCLTIGKPVRIISTDSVREAFAEGIAPNGYLVCSDENGSFTVNSGEVSVRGLLDYI